VKSGLQFWGDPIKMLVELELVKKNPEGYPVVSYNISIKGINSIINQKQI